MSTLEAPTMSDQQHEIDELGKRLHEIESASRARAAVAEVKWQHQAAHNSKTDDAIKQILEVLDNKFGKVFAKLSAMDKKLAAIAALAALGGTALGKYVLP